MSDSSWLIPLFASQLLRSNKERAHDCKRTSIGWGIAESFSWLWRYRCDRESIRRGEVRRCFPLSQAKCCENSAGWRQKPQLGKTFCLNCDGNNAERHRTNSSTRRESDSCYAKHACNCASCSFCVRSRCQGDRWRCEADSESPRIDWNMRRSVRVHDGSRNGTFWQWASLCTVNYLPICCNDSHALFLLTDFRANWGTGRWRSQNGSTSGFGVSSRLANGNGIGKAGNRVENTSRRAER